MSSDQPTSRPPTASHRTVATTASVALAAFLVLLIVLATQLRNNPTAAGLAARPKVVVVRRIYETTIHERIIGASGKSGATTVSSSSPISAPPLPATPVTTHTS